MLSVGAYGIVSVASHVAGKRLAAMIRQYVAGNVAGAAQLHRELFPLFKGLFATTSPIPVKAAVNLLGIPAGKPRLPLCELTAQELAQLTRLLQETGCLPA